MVTEEGTERPRESSWRAVRAELVSFVRRRVGAPDVAEEIVHDVLVKGLRALPSLDKPASLRAWLFTTTRRAIADHHRRRRLPTVPLHDTDEVSAEPARDPGPLEVTRCLEPLIDSLAPKYRAAVRGFDLNGRSHAELADELGLSVSGTKSRVQRGRQMLREALLSCCLREAAEEGRSPTLADVDDACTGRPGDCGP